MPSDDVLNILLVDNDGTIEGEIDNALKGIGVKPVIDFRQPRSRDIPFGCLMPKGRDFDKFDLALIDLEIFPLLASTEYRAEDLRGGTEVLPYLRREAPWLPVFAASRLFREEAEHFLAIAGSFGFDGHLPLQTFRSKAFGRPFWDGLVQGAQTLRKRAAYGEGIVSQSHNLVIDPSDAAAQRLDTRFGGWREVVHSVFCFATKVVLRPLHAGFSGADIFKAIVRQNPEHGGSEGEWVLKVSNSPWKLNREVQAHLEMLRAGLDHARMVPLLWQGVIVHRHVGAIAYKFAEGTKEASAGLHDVEGAAELCKRLAPMFSRLYQKKQEERSTLRKLLAEWSEEKNILVEAADELAGSEAEDLLRGVAAESTASDLLNADVEFHQCLVHGDLHLGNIMLGSRDAKADEPTSPDVLIDFARSAVGPIAVDAAKLISDILLRVPEARRDDLPTWDTSSEPWASIIRPLVAPFGFAYGDKRLFSLFLTTLLATSLRYEDVPASTKEWARSALRRQRFA